MENELEKRVSKLEQLTKKLGQSSQITNEVVTELTSELSGIVREQLKEEMVTREKEIESNVLISVTGQIDKKVKEVVDDRGLNRKELTRLKKVRDKRFIELLGSPDSDRYKLFIKFYQSAMGKGYRKKFDCSAYGDVDASRFKEALEYEENFNISDDYYSWCIEVLHNDYRNDELPNNKLVHAYERYFGINIA